MEIGIVVFGIKARLTALFVNGPLMPGPLRKNPNASLTNPHVYPGYSSEENTYLKRSVSPVGMKSNDRTDISLILTPEIVSRSLSGVSPAFIFAAKKLAGFAASAANPVDNITPPSKPRFEFTAVNEPWATAKPLYVIFDAVTPPPNRTSSTSCCGVRESSTVSCANASGPMTRATMKACKRCAMIGISVCKISLWCFNDQFRDQKVASIGAPCKMRKPIGDPIGFRSGGWQRY